MADLIYATISPNERIVYLDNNIGENKVLVTNPSIIANPSHYKYDGTEFLYDPPPSRYHSIDDAGNWYLNENLLNEYKEYIWTKIKEKRDARKVGGVLVDGKWFHSDSESRIQQLGLVLMGNNIPTNLKWKTLDGTFVIMTPSLALGIFQAIAYSDTVAFGVAEQHKIDMYASNDPYNYNYHINWSAIYGES